jgi:hypothetical protein
VRPLEKDLEVGERVAAKAGCDPKDLTCLRRAPVRDLVPGGGGSLEATSLLFSHFKPHLNRSVTHHHLFQPLKRTMMTGHFLLQQPMARRPAQESRSAARGISTGVTSRRTGGRARQVGQAVGF